MPLGVDGFVPLSQLSHTPVKNIAESFKVGDDIPLKVIEFDKESKKIVLSALEYLRGKEQKLVDDYVASHKLTPMTMKDVVSTPSEVEKLPDELSFESKDESTPEGSN
jgi:small subunit ribosomal protein S1